MSNKQIKQDVNQPNNTITLRIKEDKSSSGGGLIFLLILIILAVVVYLYHNQILGYLENNKMFQTIKNNTIQLINESQQALNIIQNSLSGNISLNDLYTSNNQNNTNTSG
jgi:hypothetical protein